jgi:hypothetical protein
VCVNIEGEDPPSAQAGGTNDKDFIRRSRDCHLAYGRSARPGSPFVRR